MEKIPTRQDNPNGLHQRYKIQKIVPTQEQDFFGNNHYTYKDADKEAEYFVMRLDTGGSDLEHIKACRIAINAYADAISKHIPELANDLKKRYPIL
jgi:hypothetical protein